MRARVFRHIKSQSAEKGIYLDTIGGYSEHCHLLMSLGPEQKIADVVRLLKGESSHWINTNNICREHFAWQDDYFAVSVSEGHLAKVRQYIRTQEKHHSTVLFVDELKSFMGKYGWSESDSEGKNSKSIPVG